MNRTGSSCRLSRNGNRRCKKTGRSWPTFCRRHIPPLQKKSETTFLPDSAVFTVRSRRTGHRKGYNRSKAGGQFRYEGLWRNRPGSGNLEETGGTDVRNRLVHTQDETGWRTRYEVMTRPSSLLSHRISSVPNSVFSSALPPLQPKPRPSVPTPCPAIHRGSWRQVRTGLSWR